MDYHHLRGPLVLSILAAITTIGIKSTAYWLTGSAGLLSDALESFVNLLAAVAAYLSVWYSSRPADPEHTYGHEKIEYFSSGLEGALVIVAGLGTVWLAIDHLIRPRALEQLGLGILLAGLASLINLAVAIVLLRVGKKYGSIVLEADGHHLMSDVLTTAGVLVGLVLVELTGFSQLDAILALLVGLNIVYTGFRLIRRSFDGLMDRALSTGEIVALRDSIRSALPPGADFHYLRTRRAGRRQLADFHLLVDGSMTVRDAHALAHQVEEKLRIALPVLEVTIHIEPIDEQSSWEATELARLGEQSAPEPGAATTGVSPPIDD